MRLLFCIDHFGPGGAQRQLLNIAGGLVKRGHEVDFYIYFPDIDHFTNRAESLGSKIHVRQKASKYSAAPVLSLAKLLRNNRYDCALAFLRTPSVYLELAGIFAPAVPVVVSERFMYTQMTPALRARQELHRLATWITVNSHHQRSRMEAMFPWMARKITTIYNGVDLDAFSPPELPRQPHSDGTTRLLVVSSTAQKKNAIGLARALAILKSQGSQLPTVSWAGVPTGPKDELTKQEVNAFLDSADLAHRWTWLGARSDIPTLMRTHDALVHPAFFEGLPNAICEALACGLPVIASNVCDHPILLGDGRGLLFDPTSPTDMARALTYFMAAPSSVRHEISLRGRDYASTALTLERCAAEYEELFKNLRHPHASIKPKQESYRWKA